jgi:hypothetical protein
MNGVEMLIRVPSCRPVDHPPGKEAALAAAAPLGCPCGLTATRVPACKRDCPFTTTVSPSDNPFDTTTMPAVC